jgi:hypothetical protein
MDRANLDEAPAPKAAEVALSFLTEHIPQLGGLLGKAGGAEGIADRLGGLFGKRD